MKIIDKARREFLSKYFGDISKAIFTVGLASKLFIDLPSWLRVALIACSVMLLILAFFLQPIKEGDRT